MEASKCEEYSNIIQITVNEAPISGLQAGAVAAPDIWLFVVVKLSLLQLRLDNLGDFISMVIL